MKIAYLGSKRLGLLVFHALHERTPGEWRVIHPQDTADPRSVLDEFSSCAVRCGVDFLVAVSHMTANEMIKDFEPDVIMVNGWYWLIPPEVLNLPKLGAFGIHNSLLPKYRGGAPLVWSIINGEHTVGSTCFRLTGGMDDGPILKQFSVPLGPDETVGIAVDRIEREWVGALPDAWAGLLAGKATLTPQDERGASYCGQRAADDGRIDWSWPAMRIHDFVRAQSAPYPGAFTIAKGRKITLNKARIDPRRYYGTAGQVLFRTADSVLVACGDDTALSILETSVDGIPMSPNKALPSIDIRLG